MEELIGNPAPAGWLHVPAFLLLLVPMNLLLGGAVIAAVTAMRDGSEARRLVGWLKGTFPGALACLAGACAAEALVPRRPGVEIFSLWLMPGSGLVPWLLHVFLAAIAVAGMIVALHGLIQRKRDASYGDQAVQHGMRWFVIPTALQMVAGFYLLLALPGPVRSRFLGGSPAATAELMVGIVLAIAAFSVVTHATHAAAPRPLLMAGVALLSATLIVMALLRAQVRSGRLEQTLDRLPGPHPPPGDVAISLAMMAATGAGMTWWLIRRLRTAPPS